MSKQGKNPFDWSLKLSYKSHITYESSGTKADTEEPCLDTKTIGRSRGNCAKLYCNAGAGGDRNQRSGGEIDTARISGSGH